MYRVELYAQVRRSVFVEGLSEREAAKRFGLARGTVRKMLRYATPPGYRRRQPAQRPKLDPFTGIVDQILIDDQEYKLSRLPTSLKNVSIGAPGCLALTTRSSNGRAL